MPQQPPVKPPAGLFSPKRDNDFFGAIRVYPQSTEFATRDADEQVFVIARRAIITNIGWVTRIVFLIILLPAIQLGIQVLGGSITDIVPERYIPFIPLFYYSFLLTYAIIKVNEWFFNVMIITNKRVLDIDFSALTGKHVAEANLTQIEDVSQTKIGFFPAFFNYGDLMIQTAGQRNKFFFPSIPNPTWFRNVLVDLARASQNPEP